MKVIPKVGPVLLGLDLDAVLLAVVEPLVGVEVVERERYPGVDQRDKPENMWP